MNCRAWLPHSREGEVGGGWDVSAMSVAIVLVIVDVQREYSLSFGVLNIVSLVKNFTLGSVKLLCLATDRPQNDL